MKRRCSTKSYCSTYIIPLPFEYLGKGIYMLHGDEAQLDFFEKLEVPLTPFVQ